MEKKYLIIIVVIFISLGFLTHTILKSEKPKSQEKIEEVSLRLKWIDQAQFSGYYLAKSEGLYKKNGIDVEIVPGGPDVSPVQMVASGVNDFGITGADQIILSRAKGVPLVALAVIYKDSPVAVISLKDKEIESPKDLEEKKVAVVYGRDEEILYRLLLNKESVDRSKINEVASLASPTEVINLVDARVGYELNCAVLLSLMGHDLNLIKPRDYGINFYGDTLFTTEKMIKENPDLVRKFVEATIKGWEMAIENPEKAIAEVLRINNTLDVNHQTKFLEKSIPIIASKEKVGYSEKEIWEEMQRNLIDQEILKDSISIEEAFTNEFLE